MLIITTRFQKIGLVRSLPVNTTGDPSFGGGGSIDELRYVVDRWRMDYNHDRPHSSLDYMAPAAFVVECLEQGSSTLCLTQDKENSCGILLQHMDQ
jgi:hypothetical protein